MNISYTFIGTKDFWQVTIYYDHKPTTVISTHSWNEALAIVTKMRQAGIPLEHLDERIV